MWQKMRTGLELAWPSDLTLPGLLEQRAASDPDALILIDAATGAEMSLRRLRDAYRKAARGLAALGFGRGDCLCTLMGNDFAWYVGALAAQSLGGTISGINPLAKPDEIARQFSAVPAKAVLAVPPLLGMAREVASKLGIRFVLSTASGDAATPALGAIDGPEVEPDETVQPEDIALLPFSSGSSGLPKAVMLTHRNMIAGAAQIETALDLSCGDRMLGLAPLFHIVGPNVFAAALLAGAAVVVVPRPDPALVFDALEKHRVTHMPMLTPFLGILARHPAGADRDYSSLRLVGAGGIALAPSIHAEAARRFGCPVVQAYGMTETSSIVTIDDIDDPAPATVGRPPALAEIRVADPDTGRSLDVGREGEIQVRGPHVFRGYLGRPDETARSFTPDGWFRTGDLGRFRGDGRLTITGRIKEMIKVHTAQVAPAELEMLLVGHETVADAAVIGRPNAYCGEVPVAYVVLKVPTDPFAILDWLNDQVIHYKRLRGIEIVAELPKNGSGKIDRRALAALDTKRGEEARRCAA